LALALATEHGLDKDSMTASSKRQMVINHVAGQESRVAVVKDGRMEELHSERVGATTFVGNIYVGRVTNVEAGIQAAFVDFGLESNGFLHVSDLHPRYFPGDEKTEKIGQKTPRRERPPIQDCLKRGQEVIVQVLKEGINTKGPTLTSYLSIPGRYLVMLPWMDKVGVSRRVEDEDVRREMRKSLDTLDLPDGFGFILRTAGMGRNKTELKRDLAFLQRLWKDIEKRRSVGNRPRLLYAESDLLMRSLRDVWTSDLDEIVIDDVGALDRAAAFMKIISPRSATKLLHYDKGTPLFHAFGLEEQIARMHAREVPLPSGGSLVIDETEAMIAIDVNSGKMRDKTDAEQTAYRTNLEAIEEICRQLRLRDIGGLVVLDLIDMMRRSNRRDIETRMRDLLKSDRAATKALPISQFGMVEMTRQRVRGSLRSQHYAGCPNCSGHGQLQRPDSVTSDLLRELASLLQHPKIAKIEIVVSAAVASVVLSTRRLQLGALERSTKKHVDVRVSDDIVADRVVYYAYGSDGSDIEIDRLPKPKMPSGLKVWESKREKGDNWAVDPRFEGLEDIEEEDELEDIAPPNADEHASDGNQGTRKRRGKRGGRRNRRSSEDERVPAEERAKEAPRDAGPGDVEREESTDEEGEGGKKKRRRRGRRGGRRNRRSSEGEGDNGSQENVESGGGEEPRTEQPSQDEDGEVVKKKSRRRRGRGGSKREEGGGAKEEGAAGEVADAPKSNTKKKTSRRTSKKKVTTKTAGKDEAAAKDSKSKTAAVVVVEDAKPKPRKTLYGNRRRMSPSEVMARRSERGE
jgi:ribonuclease E